MNGLDASASMSYELTASSAIFLELRFFFHSDNYDLVVFFCFLFFTSRGRSIALLSISRAIREIRENERRVSRMIVGVKPLLHDRHGYFICRYTLTSISRLFETVLLFLEERDLLTFDICVISLRRTCVPRHARQFRELLSTRTYDQLRRAIGYWNWKGGGETEGGESGENEKRFVRLALNMKIGSWRTLVTINV